MFLKRKKRIDELAATLCELTISIYKMQKLEFLDDLVFGIESLKNMISEENLEKSSTCLDESYKIIKTINDDTTENLLTILKSLENFQSVFENEVDIKLNIVFMPYNITMWDSLETIYFSALKDNRCVVKVVPIPYFDISTDKPIAKYDGDKFDKSINIIHFNNYKIESEEPDIIYIHNIYDNYNTLTSVHPHYYTENLKKYTDMLVFSPYFVPGLDGLGQNLFNTPGIKNIDKIIISKIGSEDELLDFIPADKLMSLGSPKFDTIVNIVYTDYDYPKEWIELKKTENGEDRKVILLSTGINLFTYHPDYAKTPIFNLIDFTRLITTLEENNYLVIWRPHPLTLTQIKKTIPYLTSYYDNIDDIIENRHHHIVIDRSGSFLPAFKFSDALMTDYSSTCILYLQLNKPVIGTRPDVFNCQPDIFDGNAIYAPTNKTFDFLRGDETIKKIEKTEVDNDFLSKYYYNVDGTAGEKIHKAVIAETLK